VSEVIVLSSEVWDLIRETPLYQYIARREQAKGREIGREIGREQVRQEHLAFMRNVLLTMIQTRYPALEELAAKQLYLAKHPEELENAWLEIALATSAEEVEQCLLTLGNAIDQ
jgi:predicted transposase YdaD